MGISKTEAEALTTIAIACRPHGAPRWDPQGVMANLAKVQHLSLADVAMATIRAAADRTINNPGIIATTTSSVWRERLTPPEPHRPPRANEACLTCHQWLHHCICGEKRTRPAPRGDTAAGIAKARAAIRQATQETTT